MSKKQSVSIGEDYEQLVGCIPYLLAGLEGLTNGHQINSIAVQQTGLSGFRIILRATGDYNGESSVHLVSFTTASDPGAAILLAEEGYRENVTRWSIDRYAQSISDRDSSKNDNGRLSIRE